MARPRKQIDPRQVEQLALIGCTYDEMAAVLGCSTDTLKRRFADLIEKGRESGKASLRRKQFEAAMKGDRTMLVWLGKQYLGQRDQAVTETTGEQTHVIKVVRAEMTLERDDALPSAHVPRLLKGA